MKAGGGGGSKAPNDNELPPGLLSCGKNVTISDAAACF